MAAKANRRLANQALASATISAARKSTVGWSVLSALGGAGLAFLGQVAIEEYRAPREAKMKVDERQLAEDQNRTQFLDNLFNEYDGLGERADRASDFIEANQGGSKEDVMAVVRHFRKVVAYVVNGRLEANAVSGIYGGRLTRWSRLLRELGGGTSPVSSSFTENSRRNFLVLSDALAHLARLSSSDAALISHSRVSPQPPTLRWPRRRIAVQVPTLGAEPSRDSEAATVDVPNADGDEPLAQAHTMPANERPLVQRVTDNITALLNRQATDPAAAENLQHVSRAFGVDPNKPADAQAEDAIDAVVELSVTPGALAARIADLKDQHGVDLGQ